MTLSARLVFLSISVLIPLPSFAAQSYSELGEFWQRSKSKPGYVEYREEFIQYNNTLHLDTKDGCFGQDPGPVNIYLIINGEGVVESVITDLNNAKARCFKATYLGLQLKSPPFSPLIINMHMGVSRP